jgi:hypothetical protein
MSEFSMPLNDAHSSGLSELEIKIKELFNLTPPAYYQMLNNLIDREAALMAEPLLVKRLLRVRQQRTSARSSSKLGFTL